MALSQSEETHRVTIELPEPVYRLLSDIAAASHQSLESLATQSIKGNLPPSVETAPVPLHDALIAMQSLPVEALVEIANEQIGPDQALRHSHLLELNSAQGLSPEERQELGQLRLDADQLMVRKAYAWALLRWRGHRVPHLGELPLP